MTDWSVERKTCLVATPRAPKGLQRTVRALIKMLLQEASATQPLVRTVQRFIGNDQERPLGGEPVDELIQVFLAVRNQLNQQSLPAQQYLEKLGRALQEVAVENGVEPLRFYHGLLARILEETDPAGTPLTALKLSTKDKVLQAALEVFAEKGFYVATVDEVAERAGLGKGTLYRYFANKEALFNELVRVRLEELEKCAQEVLDGQDDVLTMIIKYLRVYFEFFDRNQHLYRVIVQEHLDFGKQMQDLYIKKVMRRIPILKRKIYEATQQGIFKSVDFQTVFYGVMGFVHGVIQKWVANDCSYSLVDELPTVVETLFFGFVQDRNLKVDVET
jgi:AcrR family transcriptional regulator